MGVGRDLSVFDDDNAQWRSQRKRVPWEERVKLIDEQFPGLRNLDFNVLLRDNDTFARLLKDILKVDQMEPGRGGPRPNLDRERGMQTWSEWTGRDFSELPFPQAFKLLTGAHSYTQIARTTKLARSRVYRLMQGWEQPSVNDMRDIAGAYGKKPAFFAEYRADYLTAAFAARLATETELTISLYLKLVRS